MSMTAAGNQKAPEGKRYRVGSYSANKGTIIALVILSLFAAMWLWQVKAYNAEQLRLLTAQQQPKVDQLLRLSNGKNTWIGQSEQLMLLMIGQDLRQASPGLYQYPGELAKPVEVSIYVKENKVTGLLVTKDSSNRTLLGNAGIGASSAELQRNMPAGLAAINTQQDAVKQRGYKRTGIESNTYWLLPGCGGGEQVVSVLLVLNGYTEALSPFSVPPRCAVGGST
jgi:hypothetical protein